MRTTRHALLTGALPALFLGVALAAWPTDPRVNLPLCTVDGSQIRPAVVSDGAGGLIVAWQDSRAADADIYAQRVSANGDVIWAANGVVVCDVARSQWEPAIVGDGAGGAIVVWEDHRAGSAPDVWAQRLDASGTPLWTSGGVPVVVADDTQEDVAAVADGAGEVIVVWVDERSAAGSDLLAQRLDAGGSPQWGPDGVPVCTAAGDQYDAEIVSDGQGGAIVVWQDDRPADVHLQRLTANGTALWTPDGIPLSAGGGYSSEHEICGDGAGGVIVAFTDDRLGSRDIFAQRFDASGAPQWAQDGIALCTDAAQQDDASLCPDGGGGAIVSWEDYRGADRDVYAQRVDALGDVVWTLDGVLVCGEPEMQATTVTVADGAGGAVVVWRDWREYVQKIGEDLYAQRLDASGTLLWEATGHPVATADDAQQGHVALPAETGAVFVVWEDRRDERTSQSKQDLYAQHVDGGGGAVAACTIGSAVVLQGAGFGTKKKPQAYVVYERKPGKQKTAKLKVGAWTDTTIDATWKKKVPLGSYEVWVRPKGGQAVASAEITIVGPAPDAGQSLSGTPKSRLAVTGTHFGSRKGKVLVEYVTSKGKTRRKACKVVKKAWVMDPVTGASSADFVVPKLPPGTYDLIVANKLGESRLPLTIVP